MVYPLHELRPGEWVEIVWVIGEPPVSLWLEELGLTAAVRATCILRGRRGHVSAYQIQGIVIALRPQNARGVSAQVLNPG